MRRVEVGDVYPAKGGRGDTKYWIVVGIGPKSYATVLGLDESGHVVSGCVYGTWALEGRPPSWNLRRSERSRVRHHMEVRMTEEDCDEAHEAYLQISKEINQYADRLIDSRKLNPEQEEYVRQYLSETMRFWKESK
jgi:hypothetical protein